MRANASTLSHAQLDEAETLDSGDPIDLAERYRELRQVLSRIGIRTSVAALLPDRPQWAVRQVDYGQRRL